MRSTDGLQYFNRILNEGESTMKILVIRKFIFLLNNCIRKTATSNSLLADFLNSDIFLTSKIVRKWHDLLYCTASDL